MNDVDSELVGLEEVVEIEVDYGDDAFAVADVVPEARIEVAKSCLGDCVAEKRILAGFAVIFGDVGP